MKAGRVGTKLQLRPEGRERAKRPRLAGFSYAGIETYHVTLQTRQREPVFVEASPTSYAVEALSSVAEKLHFQVLAYCFMPDHAHLLLHGTDRSVSLLRFIQRFKQLTSYRFKQQEGRQLWQQSFFDRVLREDEDIQAIASYIFQNPVEAGLVQDSREYPYIGGLFWPRGSAADGAKASSLRSDNGSSVEGRAL